jgi:hypothetical protein
MGIGAAVAGAGSLISAGSSLIGGSQASGAASNAASLQQQQAAQTRADLLPYNQTGQAVLPNLQSLVTGGPTGGGPDYVSQAAGLQPGQMTQAELEATPGYQFNLSQGLQATQNAAAARGLGVSGAALKGAATFATGLADSTYQNQFNNAQTRFQNALNLNTAQQGNLTNQYSRLLGTASLGENAAAQTGSTNQLGTNAAGNYLNQSGQLGAAGTAGVGSAITGAANNYLTANLLQQAIGSGKTGGYPAPVNPGGNNPLG